MGHDISHASSLFFSKEHHSLSVLVRLGSSKENQCIIDFPLTSMCPSFQVYSKIMHTVSIRLLLSLKWKVQFALSREIRKWKLLSYGLIKQCMVCFILSLAYDWFGPQVVMFKNQIGETVFTQQKDNFAVSTLWSAISTDIYAVLVTLTNPSLFYM